VSGDDVLRVDLLGIDGLVLVGGGWDGLVGETMEVVAARGGGGRMYGVGFSWLGSVVPLAHRQHGCIAYRHECLFCNISA
jgi:hypothetical protein